MEGKKGSVYSSPVRGTRKRGVYFVWVLRHILLHISPVFWGAPLMGDKYRDENFRKTNIAYLWGNEKAKLDPILFFLTG